MSIGTDHNINFSCRYSRTINTQQSFDVTQASFHILKYFLSYGSNGLIDFTQDYTLKKDSELYKIFIENKLKSLQGATANGVLVYEASVVVSEMGDTRTLLIEPKHGLTDIYARFYFLQYNNQLFCLPLTSLLKLNFIQSSTMSNFLWRKRSPSCSLNG